MEIVLFRHAKSSWDYPVADIHRPLNARGLRQSQQMAKNCQLDKPARVLCSVASRAYATALAYQQAGWFSASQLTLHECLYFSPLEQVLALIATVTEEPLWIFGHNPQLETLAEYFTSRQITLKTSCYVQLRINALSPGCARAGEQCSPQ